LQTVVHAYQLHEIVDRLATPGTSITPPALQTSTLQQYYRGTEKLFGTAVYSTGRISVDSSNDAYGATFSKSAFIYLVGWEPDTWLEEDGSLRGWEMGIVADYGMVEEDGTYGRYLYFTSAAPTS